MHTQYIYIYIYMHVMLDTHAFAPGSELSAQKSLFDLRILERVNVLPAPLQKGLGFRV